MPLRVDLTRHFMPNRRNLSSIVRLSSEHSRIFRALFTVTIYLGLAKLVGAGKEVAIAAKYGANPTADAYALLFSLVSWPISVWGSVLNAILVPMLISLQSRSSDIAAFNREFMSFTVLVALGLTAVFGVGLWIGLAQNVFGLAAPVQKIALLMVEPVALLMPFSMVSTFLAARLMASHKYTNSLLDGAPSLMLLVTVVALPAQTPWPLVFGLVGGFMIQALLLGAAQPAGERGFKLKFSMQSPEWSLFWVSFASVVASQLILSLSNVVDQSMVAHLGPRSNAILGYANRILTLFTTLGGTAIARALLPILSELNAKGGATKRFAVTWVALNVGVGLAVLLVGWIAAPWLVKALYQRGAFTAQDAADVTRLLRFSLIQLPFFLGCMVANQFIAAAKRYNIFLYSNIFNIAVKVGANLVLIPRTGLNGVAISTAIMYASCLAILAFAILKADTNST